MEFEQLSHIHIVIPAAEAIQNSSLIEAKGNYFSFLLNVHDESALTSDLTFIYSSANQQGFTVTLHFKNDIDEKTYNNFINKLCLIISHPNYLKYHNNYLLGVLMENNVNDKMLLLKTLTLDLKKQAYDKLEIVDIGNEVKHKWRQKQVSLTEDEAFYNWFIEALISQQTVHNIMVLFHNAASVKAVSKLKSYCEEKIKTEQPVLYNLFLLLIAKTTEISQYKEVVLALSEEVASKKSYLNFLTGLTESGEIANVNEVIKIKKFYHQEYEVLPLWFKRFGHIIKVCMGKRSLKSLFDGNAKKNVL